MNYVKRAIFSFIYYIKRNALLFFVYLIVALLLISTYCLRNQVVISMENMKKSFGVSVSLLKKDSNLFPYYESNFFPYDIAKKVGENPKIKEASYFSIAPILNNSVSIDQQDSWEFRTFVTGITNTEDHWQFKDGNNKLIKGRFLTKEDEGKPYAIISDQTASDNNLDIGDKFTAQSYLHRENQIELEVVGIFSVEGSEAYLLIFNSSYIVYTPASVAAELNNGGIMEADFSLNEPNDIKSFIDDGSKIIQDYPDIVFTEKSSDFAIASMPMNSILNLCNVILLSTILMAIIVLCLLVLYMITGRFRELGILLSMGEAKFKIILQMICEIIVPMLIAITFAIFISKILILPFIEKWSLANLGIGSINLGNSSLLMYCVGLILAILSSLIPALNILRYNPKEILDKYE